MKSFTWYQECKVINNVRRVRTSSNSQRWADRIDEFSATQHNNTTNIYKQTAHSTEYKFIQVATFITCIGQEALKGHNGLPFKTDEEKKDITKILELWGEYCNGKTNIIYERYKFNNRQQKADERIDAYATVLRDLASSCNYGILNEEMIRDRIVCGITNSAVRKKLLQIPDLTYDKCMDVCRAAEATETQMSAMKTTESTYLPNDSINVVGANSRKKPSGNESARTGGQPATECRYCGRHHNRGRNNCPAFGKSCSKCGKINHFAAKKKLDKQSPSQRKRSK